MARNKELLQKVVDAIREHPDQWDQTTWHCGTSHCVAGWAEILSGRIDDRVCELVSKATGESRGFQIEDDGDGETRVNARGSLRLSRSEADWLFDSDRDLQEIVAFNDAVQGDDEGRVAALIEVEDEDED
jgi:hypothetical protein